MIPTKFFKTQIIEIYYHIQIDAFSFNLKKTKINGEQNRKAKSANWRQNSPAWSRGECEENKSSKRHCYLYEEKLARRPGTRNTKQRNIKSGSGGRATLG